jgi:glycosyltransferase involved in cell wall biosynthesis
MRVLFALPGLHRIDRGAEIAFISIAREIAGLGCRVTLTGSGFARDDEPYGFVHAGSISRTFFRTFPSLPILRNDCAYEELTFAPGFFLRYRPTDYDVSLTCSYPFTNWMLRRPVLSGHRPPHVFVTQNGDWPAFAKESEFRFFSCEGLVCTNPDFYARNRNRWRSALIPNGVDLNRFTPGSEERKTFGLPPDRLIVLMVSALIPSKRIEIGIEAVRRLGDAHLVVAGTGPLKSTIETMAAKLLPNRFTLLSVSPEKMPALYRSAHVLLHLSKEEAFGNIFLEALACGTPVVAEDSSRVRWIVGDRQFLTNTDDPDLVATQIAAAAKGAPEGEADRIAQAASFSWARIGRMYKDFLDEVVNQ